MVTTAAATSVMVSVPSAAIDDADADAALAYEYTRVYHHITLDYYNYIMRLRISDVDIYQNIHSIENGPCAGAGTLPWPCPLLWPGDSPPPPRASPGCPGRRGGWAWARRAPPADAASSPRSTPTAPKVEKGVDRQEGEVYM